MVELLYKMAFHDFSNLKIHLSKFSKFLVSQLDQDGLRYWQTNQILLEVVQLSDNPEKKIDLKIIFFL